MLIWRWLPWYETTRAQSKSPQGASWRGLPSATIMSTNCKDKCKHNGTLPDSTIYLVNNVHILVGYIFFQEIHLISKLLGWMIEVFCSRKRNVMDYQYTFIHRLQIYIHTCTIRKKYESQSMFIWVYLSLIREWFCIIPKINSTWPLLNKNPLTLSNVSHVLGIEDYNKTHSHHAVLFITEVMHYIINWVLPTALQKHSWYAMQTTRLVSNWTWGFSGGT